MNGTIAVHDPVAGHPELVGDRGSVRMSTVAGFDFAFTYIEAQDAIVRVCLAAGRARAHQLGLSWRWRSVGPRRLCVTVSGNSRSIDILGYRLERDLPLVAEGSETGSMTRAQRQRIGRGFADMMLRGRHVEQEKPMVLRGVTETRWYYAPYVYSCPGYPRVHARLSTTEEVLVGWNFQEVAPETLLEELHTACELVLEEIINRRSRRMAFAELVEAAEDAGVLSRFDEDVPPVELLIALKDLRKEVRHRAAEGAREWLDGSWEDVAILLERLVSRLNTDGPANP